MGRLEFGSLREAWAGEASDFTPHLVQQLDAIGSAIGVDLLAVGEAEVATAGGRSIDIVAQGSDDGTEYVIENQYGRADHDHLTRGLAYAVAREARGLIVVAENHRDEFRAVAQYLNDLAEHDPARGIAVWLVEAKAARIDDSRWAPLFTAVVAPNVFTARVEMAKQADRSATLEGFLEKCASEDTREAVRQVVAEWRSRGRHAQVAATSVSLYAPGPARSGKRAVVSLLPDGRIQIDFSAYAGTGTGVPIPGLTKPAFRSEASSIFGFSGDRRVPKTKVGWLTPSTVSTLLVYADRVADEYAVALADTSSD
jgi:hypothetical protein